MKKTILLALSATYLFANVQSVDIYKNRTFVNQTVDLSKKEVKLLSFTNLEDIRYTLPKQCKVSNSKIVEKKDDFSKKIVKKQQYLQDIEAQIKSFENSIGFFQKISVQDVKSFDKLAKTSSYIYQESLKLYTKLEQLKNVKKKAQEELNELLKIRETQKAFYLTFDSSCSSKGTISYSFNSLSKNLFYTIKQDNKTNKLNIKNSAFITQTSGVDLENITINLYSYDFDNRVKPYKFYPQYLDIYEPPVVMYDAVPQKAEFAGVAMKRSVKKQPSFSYFQSGTKAVFQAQNITLNSGAKTEVVFANDNYASKALVQIDGFSTAKPFYKVEFKSSKNYMPLLAKFYLDNLYVGQTRIESIKKGKNTELYFGQDDFVKVEKKLKKDMKEKPFFSMNKLKTQKIYSYKVTNNQKTKLDFELIERVPVSKHEDIKVKLISNKGFTKKEDNGKVIYSFSLQPKESYNLEYGYEVEKPNKK